MAVEHFRKYFEHADPLVRNDVILEFERASFASLSAIAKEMGPEQLRTGIATKSKSMPGHHAGLYATMLGICGNVNDADLLKQKILAPKPPDEELRQESF